MLTERAFIAQVAKRLQNVLKCPSMLTIPGSWPRFQPAKLSAFFNCQRADSSCARPRPPMSCKSIPGSVSPVLLRRVHRQQAAAGSVHVAMLCNLFGTLEVAEHAALQPRL